MAPNEFFVRLQKGMMHLLALIRPLRNIGYIGITGGFAPPTPSEIHALTRSTDRPHLLAVDSQYRQDGTPSLQSTNLEPKTVSLEGNNEHQGLVDELHGILKTLPTEKPAGSQDIYGMDTSIAWGSADLEWYNGGPSGCSGGTSTVQATDEEKAKFKRAVEIVRLLATK